MTPPSRAASNRSRPRGIVHRRPKKLVVALFRFWSTKTSTRTSSNRLNPSAHQATPVRVTGTSGEGTADRAGSAGAVGGSGGVPGRGGATGGRLALSLTSHGYHARTSRVGTAADSKCH